jgi:predicted metal-dependent HD superfamily phosphohydrolase
MNNLAERLIDQITLPIILMPAANRPSPATEPSDKDPLNLAGLQLQPYACEALSSLINRKLERALAWVENHPLLEGPAKDQLQAALDMIRASQVIPRVFFALEVLIGEKQNLKYHGPNHSWRVFQHAILFALHEGHAAREVFKVAVAAALHDIGFSVRPVHNEPVAAQYAAVILEQQRQAPDQTTTSEIADIQQMILNTYTPCNETGRLIPPIPQNKLAACLIDADFSNLGSPEFFEWSGLLFSELTGEREKPLTLIIDSTKGRRFADVTRLLLHDFNYTTQGAQKLLGPTKDRNEELLLSLLKPLV